MNVVEAPKLDIWSAKFVAFPPGNGSKRATSAWKSPGVKCAIGGVTKSTIPSPTATTRGGREANPSRPPESLTPQLLDHERADLRPTASTAEQTHSRVPHRS